MSEKGEPELGASRLLSLIGNTPLLPLRNLTRGLPPEVTVHVKAEWFNPGGSVKDRAASAIVRDALASGALEAGGTLLDASSGNTGIAYAMLGAALGFKVALCLPENANAERKRTLRAYGAELILTDPELETDGAILEARRLAKAHPERYFYADQYSNDSNWKMHFATTGPELLRQTEGRLTHFVTCLGTTGTCMGVGRYLRQHLPSARVISFQPDSPLHKLKGAKHMATAIVPAIFDKSVPHEERTCSTERGYELTRRMGREEGVLVGTTAGAAIALALDVAHEEAAAGRRALVVALAPDSGERYLSESFWDEGEGCPSS